MSSSRNYHSILLSLNIAPVAMPFLATASRIPCPTFNSAPVARVPTATARSIPRPVNSLSAARRYTPAAQRTSPSTTIASMASSFAAMSISNPAKQATALPSAPASSLPCVAAPCSKLASDRIQARRQRVTANLTAAKKRPTAPASIPQSSSIPSRAKPPAVIAPVSIPQSSSIPSRAKPPAVIAPVSILKTRSKPSRVIPLPPLHARRSSTLVSSWIPPRGREPRGREPYCKGRPRETDADGNRLVWDYVPLFNFGVNCECHPEGEGLVGPRGWKTTPAEADVDPARPRIVRFADNLVSSTRTFRPWYNQVWPPCASSKDDATEADDDASIRAMDNPPAPVAIANPLPGSSDFQSTWQALMDEGFPDDDDYF